MSCNFLSMKTRKYVEEGFCSPQAVRRSIRSFDRIIYVESTTFASSAHDSFTIRKVGSEQRGKGSAAAA